MSKTGNKRLNHGRVYEMIKEVKTRNKLTEDIQIDKALIRQRIKKTLFIE